MKLQNILTHGNDPRSCSRNIVTTEAYHIQPISSDCIFTLTDELPLEPISKIKTCSYNPSRAFVNLRHSFATSTKSTNKQFFTYNNSRGEEMLSNTPRKTIRYDNKKIKDTYKLSKCQKNLNSLQIDACFTQSNRVIQDNISFNTNPKINLVSKNKKEPNDKESLKNHALKRVEEIKIPFSDGRLNKPKELSSSLISAQKYLRSESYK